MSGFPVQGPGDLDPDGYSAGQVPTYDATAGRFVPGSGGGGFDPDVPLAYFTMSDADGVLWTVTVGTDGALATMSFTPRATEGGDTRVTEAGDVRILEG